MDRTNERIIFEFANIPFIWSFFSFYCSHTSNPRLNYQMPRNPTTLSILPSESHLNHKKFLFSSGISSYQALY